MRTIALVTQKGGAGKTTLTASLAVAAEALGETVVALDLDPQGSLTAWGADRTADRPAIDAVPVGKIGQLAEILKSLSRGGYTVALLDCPGIASTSTNLAIAAADLCLIPTRPTRLDIRATKPTIEALLGLKKPFAFVLNQCPPNAKGRAAEAAIGLSLMGALAEPSITARADFQDAMAAGLGVIEYAPSGKAASEIAALWAWIDKRMKGIKHG
jgi:chromosome partitioning protein